MVQGGPLPITILAKHSVGEAEDHENGQPRRGCGALRRRGWSLAIVTPSAQRLDRAGEKLQLVALEGERDSQQPTL